MCPSAWSWATRRLVVRAGVAATIIDHDGVFDGADRFSVPDPAALTFVERARVAVVGADRGHRGVLEPSGEPPRALARLAGALLAGGAVVAGALAGPGDQMARRGEDAHVGPISARITSAVRRGTPGIVHNSSTAGSKGAMRASIASESRSICSTRKSRWARIAPISGACSSLKRALERFPVRRDLPAQPGLGQVGEHLWVGRILDRARRASRDRRRPAGPRQLGHSNLGITSVYLQGIDNAEIIETVHARRAPMIPVSASLRSWLQATLAPASTRRSGASALRCHAKPEAAGMPRLLGTPRVVLFRAEGPTHSSAHVGRWLAQARASRASCASRQDRPARGTARSRGAPTRAPGIPRGPSAPARSPGGEDLVPGPIASVRLPLAGAGRPGPDARRPRRTIRGGRQDVPRPGTPPTYNVRCLIRKN